MTRGDDAPSRPDPLGSHGLGDAFEFRAELGEGAYGLVCRARDRKLDRDVAIKLLKASHLQDPDSRKRFEREARLASRVRSPHVAAIFDAGTTDSALYLVTEFIAGPTLDHRVRAGGPVPLDQAVEILAKVLDGLAAIHEAGIIHRDIKPANVLLADGGQRPVIIDLGLAFSDDVTRITRPNQAVGTPTYFSPELILGEPLTPASDLYSFSIVAFTVLTGQRPYPRTSLRQMLESHLSQPPRRLEDSGRPVPEPLEAVIARGLAKDPGHRFPNALAMREALLAIREDTATGPTGRTDRATRVPIREPQDAEPPSPSPLDRRTPHLAPRRRSPAHRALVPLLVGRDPPLDPDPRTGLVDHIASNPPVFPRLRAPDP